MVTELREFLEEKGLTIDFLKLDRSMEYIIKTQCHIKDLRRKTKEIEKEKGNGKKRGYYGYNTCLPNLSSRYENFLMFPTEKCYMM